MTIGALIDYLNTLPRDMEVIESAHSDTVPLEQNGFNVVEVVQRDGYLQELYRPFAEMDRAQRRQYGATADKVKRCLRIGTTA